MTTTGNPEDLHERPFLVSGATLDGESVGPLFATSAEAHSIARQCIAGIGGTVRILRDGGSGWREVARYTDRGGYLVDGRRVTPPMVGGVPVRVAPPALTPCG